MSNALTSVWRFILPAGVFGKYGGGAARSILFLACAFAFGSMASRTWVQEVYAQIKGVVTDPTGAAVPDAQVTATNTQTNAVKTVSTEGNGSFQFLQTPVGSYSITVTKTGFRSFTETGITLALNQVYNLPVELSVGQISQSLEVQAGAAQIETNTTQLQTVIEGDKIVDLPLNGRNWTQLQQLVPGVVASSDTNRSNYATNGSQSEQNSFLLNGTDNIELPLNEPSIIPSPDAITEFNLITSTNAEYGRNSGAVLNAIIKSGTNGAKFYF